MATTLKDGHRYKVLRVKHGDNVRELKGFKVRSFKPYARPDDGQDRMTRSISASDPDEVRWEATGKLDGQPVTVGIVPGLVIEAEEA